MADEVWIVTGASRGIGAATAVQAAASGARVVVNYARDASGAAAVVERISSAGGSALAVCADVGGEAGVVELFAAADRLGRLTVLVNNAAIAAGYGRLDAIDAERTERMLRVNVLGSLLCCREAIRRMARSAGGEGGAIVNVSSVAARLGGTGEWVDYAASKGAIDTLTVGLAREVAGDGIRVNAVRPGLVDTAFNDFADAGRLARVTPGIPFGRAGTPEEIAEAICWLASPAASYTSGAILDVSGAR